MKKALFLGLSIATAVIVASLFVQLSAFAEQTCPVSVKVQAGGFGDHVHFKNLAAQPITGIVFHSQRLNAVGEEKSATEDEARAKVAFGIPDKSEQTYSDRKGLASNAEKSISDNMAFYGRREKGDQYVTYVRAVRFLDGSVWNDDGSHSCKGSGFE